MTKEEYNYPGWNKCSDGGSGIKGNLIFYNMPDVIAQNDRFTPKTTSCSMQTGLAYVSQSIKAFAYCILGVQVNVQISILCSGERVKEVQTKFLFFMEGTGCVEILAGY